MKADAAGIVDSTLTVPLFPRVGGDPLESDEQENRPF